MPANPTENTPSNPDFRNAAPVVLPPRTTREKVEDAFVKQGVVVMVLLLGLYVFWSWSDYGIKVGIPAAIQSIHNGYKEIQEDHAKDVAVRDRQVDRIVGVLEREQEANRAEYKLLTDQHGTMKELLSEIKATRRESYRPAPAPK